MRQKINKMRTNKSILHKFALILTILTAYTQASGTISAVSEANIHDIYKELTATRHKGKGLLVLFYSPNCGHCQAFEKMYLKAAQKLADKSEGGLKFMKADCQKNPTLIPAFQVMYFPYLVYFAQGLPKTKMPLMLTSTTGLAEQWMNMMDQKYRRSQLKKHKGEKKVDLAGFKKEHQIKFKKALDTDKDIYRSIVEHAKTELGYKHYHRGLMGTLFDGARGKSSVKLVKVKHVGEKKKKVVKKQKTEKKKKVLKNKKKDDLGLGGLGLDGLGLEDVNILVV